MAKIGKITEACRVFSLDLTQKEWNTITYALRCVNYMDIMAQCPSAEIISPDEFDKLPEIFESELE